MGVVWSAVNDAFGREVAIKVMLPGVAASDPTAIERFQTEARICGSIRHPGIVDVLDVGRAENGAPFLVMELLEGDSLDKILHHAGTLKPLDVLPVMRDVARTLSLAHDKGVIHRDLKPGNVFLHRLPNGQVVAKVLDFGVSKFSVAGAKTTVTRTGMVVGSPAYMSPEQAAGRLELDPRSDVYALGVILYETLAGRLPFLEENYNALMIDIAVREPPTLASLVPSLPKAVHELVAAAMMHDREDRLQSAAALADRIEATLVAIGASSTHPLPDPGGIPVGPPPSSRVTARTSSALATNARIRPALNVPIWAYLVVIAASLAITTLCVLYVVRRRAERRDAEVAAAAPPSLPPAEVAPPGIPTLAVSAAVPVVSTATAAVASAAPTSSARVPATTAGRGPSGSGKKSNTKDPTFGF
jgi:serine/threonine-protein kinase